MPKRNVLFGECDTVEGVQRLAQEIFDRIDAVETKNDDYNAKVETHNSELIERSGQ